MRVLVLISTVACLSTLWGCRENKDHRSGGAPAEDDLDQTAGNPKPHTETPEPTKTSDPEPEVVEKENQCYITISGKSCATEKLDKPFLDTWGIANTQAGTIEAQCLARAQDYYGWCNQQAGADVTSVKAKFTNTQKTKVVSVPVLKVVQQWLMMEKGKRDSLGLNSGPDGNIGLAWIQGAAYFYFANAGRTVRVHTDYGGLTTQGPTYVTVNPRQGGKHFNYLAGGPILYIPEIQRHLLFYHAEEHPGGDARKFYSSLGLAVSPAGNTSGLVFNDLGIILSTGLNPASAGNVNAVEMTGATFLLDKDAGLRIYFKDLTPTGGDVTLAVARAPMADIVKAISTNSTPVFKKYYQGSFKEPGLGGRSSPLLKSPGQFVQWPTVSYNKYLGRYMVIFSHMDPNWNSNRYTHLSYALSVDGFTWTDPAYLVKGEGEMQYPSIINPTGVQTHYTEKGFNLIYVFSKQRDGFLRWNDAVIRGIRIESEVLSPN